MKLHNTASDSIEQFTPLNGNVVKLYTCGLTVYSQPHIGNWVAYIYWDILVRTLKSEGYKVTHVQNITDVGHLTDDGDAGEDKMQKGALREGKTAWDVADKYSLVAAHEAYDILGLLTPTHMPKATDYIEQQINYVQRLEEAGFTYVIDDGVYFDTTKFSRYGEMARLDIKGLQFGARVANTGKKNPTDFAVWKFSPKEQERDMEWDSPWGKGFPGWHLECTVMAIELLGKQIDIHTGGIDHIQIHHTNEIAQTEALTNLAFSQIWMHANHLKVDGRKISKSLGNGYTLDDIVVRGFTVDAFKLLVLSKHYRTEGNFSWEILDAAQNRLRHWKNVATLRWQTHDTLENDDDKDSKHDINSRMLAAPHAALEYLANDLNTPLALANLEGLFDEIERTPIDKLQHSALTNLIESIDSMFGLHIAESTPDINDATKQLIIKRNNARDQKDWASSDAIRNDLLESGIILLDTDYRTVWHYR